MHIYTLSFITTKFQEILLRGFRVVVLTNYFSSIFHFDQNSKLKRGLIPRKKWNQNFLWICTSTHYVFHYYKGYISDLEVKCQHCIEMNVHNTRLMVIDPCTKYDMPMSKETKLEPCFKKTINLTSRSKIKVILKS